MVNWPEILRDVEHWADGFLTGAVTASLIAMAVFAILLLVRPI
jgi:NhaP-type Na+/H+ and K+/H+ antiporter